MAGWVAALVSSAGGAAPIVVADAALQQIEQVDVRVAAGETPPPRDAGWMPATLPERWSQRGRARAGSVWYRFDVRFDTPPLQPWSVWVGRATMNADLWVNGQLVGRQGRMDPDRLTRHWHTPLLFEVPNAVWRAGDNEVLVRVRAAASNDGGLGELAFGRSEQIAPLHAQRMFWQIDVVSAANVATVALGLVFALVWWRRRDWVHHGYFAAATLLWSLANTNNTVSDPPLPPRAWETLIDVAVVWALLLFALFGLRYSGRSTWRLEAGVAGLAALGCALQLALGAAHRQAAGAALLLAVLLFSIWALTTMVRRLARPPRRDTMLFAAVAVASLLVCVRDWLLKAGVLSFDHGYLLPYMAPVLLLTSAWLLAGDYARTQKDLAVLNRELAQRVAQREAELRDSFTRLAQAEREQAVANERARILRDMHDGVGAHLTSAMRQLESGRAEPAVVAQTLRESLEQLKLSIDAMNLPPGDVNALLASLRYRLQPRIEAAGLQLHWAVDALPHWSAGERDHGAMRHLQYLLFEAVSNALQHAQASELTLSAHTSDGAIRIALADNGRGFDPASRLRTMRERAALLGAELRIEPAAPGACVSVRLPAGAAPHP